MAIMHEFETKSEQLKNSSQYESNFQQMENLGRVIHDALDVEDMRWDATNTDLFPPEIFDGTPSDQYENTTYGRSALIAEKISIKLKVINLQPRPAILVMGLTDLFIPAAQRLSKVLPQQKNEITGLMTQTAILSLRNTQLNQKIRPTSSQESQLLGMMLEGFENYEATRSDDVASTHQDFMSLEWKVLSNAFHERVEEALGPENNSEFMAIRKAVKFAENWHGDQKRFDGTLNRTHILRLGLRLLEDPTFMEDPTPLKIKLTTALLHDAVEDTDVALSDIELEFGAEVKDAVDSLSRAFRVTGERRSDEEYYRGLYKQPKFVQEIKGHDRVDNLEALLKLDLNSEDRIEIIEKGVKYLDETYKFYYDLVSDCPYLLNRLRQAHAAALKFYPVVEEVQF